TGEPASVRAERAGAEEIGKRRDRVVLPVRRVPHRYAVKDVAARNGRGDCAQEKTPVGGPSVYGSCEVRWGHGAFKTVRFVRRRLVVVSTGKGLSLRCPFGEGRVKS